MIRSLAGSAISTTSNFTINIPAGTVKIWIAYPAASRGDLLDDSVRYVEASNTPVGNTFVKSFLDVEGANSEPGISYKVYTYTATGSFSGTARYSVTLPA